MSRHPAVSRHARSHLTTLLVAAGIGAAGCSSQPAQAPPQPADAAQAAWDEYRRNHPFHSQEVAVSEPLGDGRRVVIVSEPPDGVTIASLRRDHPALGSLSIKRHPLGVDGWTEDYVGLLPPMSGADLSELSSDLHMTLFGTAHGARLAPIAPVRKWRGALDVEVRPAELHAWVLGDQASFWPVDGGPAVQGSDLLLPRQTGVYVSRSPGIVLWSFPKGEPFDAQRANVRIFGVESDLVLGAIADDDAVVVVGRERVAPVDVLPPLRFETVEILATSPLPELRQSYERRQLFAGAMPGGMDWAPILLSPAILDTELGSTLNIADQLLKRWSMNGMIDYARFQYPGEPRQWAFEQPVANALRAPSLTFNWNTAASGGVVDLSEGQSLYWMGRTGALHVSYLPGDRPDPRTEAYEDRARDFFAEQGDPYLVRAVQYTALFQAFRQLGVVEADPAAGAEDGVGAGAGNDALVAAGADVFQQLMSASDADLVAMGRRSAERQFANVTAAGFKEKLIEILESRRVLRPDLIEKVRAASDARTVALMEDVKARIAEEATASARNLQVTLVTTGDPNAPKHLAVALVHSALVAAAVEEPAKWRHFKAMLRSSAGQRTADEISAAAAFLREHDLDPGDAKQWTETASMLGDVQAVEKRYREVSGARPRKGRVRTPSVVWSSGIKLMVQGGHNVGAGVPSLPRPVAPAALSRLRVSRGGMSVDPAPQAMRSRGEALGALAVRPPAPPNPSPGTRPSLPPGTLPGLGRLTEKIASSTEEGTAVIAPFASAHGGYEVEVGGSVFKAGSRAEIAEAIQRNLERQARLSGKKALTVDIVLRDSQFTHDEARAFAQSVHSRFVRRSLGAQDGYVLDRTGEAGALGSFDLSRAVVSEPVRDGAGYTIAVEIPPKAGRARRLTMSILGGGAPPPDAGTAADAAVKSGLRAPADIARELTRKLGKDGGVLLLDLAIDAQPDTSDNDPSSSPPVRHAGTTGHTL